MVRVLLIYDYNKYILTISNILKKLDAYFDDENSKFTIFANVAGLQGLIQVAQRHTRSKNCTADMLPVLRGIKV